MESNGQAAQAAEDPRLRALLADSVRMMEELAQLNRRLAAGSATPRDHANGDDKFAALEDEFRAFQQRFGAFAEESRKAAVQLDSSIRKSPYLYLLGAVGLGFLLGKAKRL